ncbi:MAG TPA: TIGR00269 family protein, partial [Candidatus Binatus sp.]|nr:TIGR00269 family protein [Candidatus Binatus sp.]
RSSIERKVRRTVNEWHMLEPQDHVALAVSGGKDSVTLLTILARLSVRFPRMKLTAITVDEGISGYREEAVEIATKYAKELGVEHVTITFEELYGQGLDDFLRTKKGERLSACSYCGVWRRKAINLLAKNVGATKIATAHNLDDIVQTYLLNLFEGDAERFVRFSPVLNDPKGMFMPRIKPLCQIPEREVALYGYTDELQFQTATCPYMTEALRNELRTILNRLEISHPGIANSAYRTMIKLRNLAEPALTPQNLQQCEACGEPTPFRLCEACKMTGRVSTSIASVN